MIQIPVFARYTIKLLKKRKKLKICVGSPYVSSNGNVEE